MASLHKLLHINIVHVSWLTCIFPDGVFKFFIASVERLAIFFEFSFEFECLILLLIKDDFLDFLSDGS